METLQRSYNVSDGNFGWVLPSGTSCQKLSVSFPYETHDDVAVNKAKEKFYTFVKS